MVIAAIPVRNALEWTQPLVSALLDGNEVDEVWLFDNGSTDGTGQWAAALADADPRLRVSERPSSRLYAMWNEMVARACMQGSVHLAILNNDIELPPGALREMRGAMGEYDLAFVDAMRDARQEEAPRPFPATWRDRTGWAFMLRADFWHGQPFAVDPGLRLWWGDDDLARRAEERNGRLCRIEGIGCFHAESRTEYPGDRLADIEHDRHYFSRIWGDS